MPDVAGQNLLYNATSLNTRSRHKSTDASRYLPGKDDSRQGGAPANQHGRQLEAPFALNPEPLARLSFDNEHEIHDVEALLGRTSPRQLLDLTADTTWLSPNNAGFLLLGIKAYGASARLRRLTVATAHDGFRALGYFLAGLDAPNLEALTLEDRTEDVPLFRKDEDYYRCLPRLPKLRELRVRGFLVKADRDVLRRLTTLEVADIAKYDDCSEAAESNRNPSSYLHHLLENCTSLERLELRRVVTMSFLEDSTDIVLPRLQHLEVLDQEEWPNTVLEHLNIPETAAVHLYTELDLDYTTRVLLNDVPTSLPSFAKTAAVAFHADTNQTAYGWTNAHASGRAAWSITGEMSLVPLPAQPALLRTALIELPALVHPGRLAYLEIHIAPHLPTYARDWRALLHALPGLRVLRVGGERAALSLLRALPVSPEQRGRAALPPRLHELALCLDTLYPDTCAYIATRVSGVAVLRIRVLDETHGNPFPREVMRACKRILQSLLQPLGTRVLVEYGAPCATCHAERESEEEDACAEDEEDELSEAERWLMPVVRVPSVRAGDEAEEIWTPADEEEDGSSVSSEEEPESSAWASSSSLASSSSDEDQEDEDCGSDEAAEYRAYEEYRAAEYESEDEGEEYDGEYEDSEEEDDSDHEPLDSTRCSYALRLHLESDTSSECSSPVSVDFCELLQHWDDEKFGCGPSPQAPMTEYGSDEDSEPEE